MLPQLPHDVLTEIFGHLGQEWQALHLQDRPDYRCEEYHTLHRTLLLTAVEPHLYSVFSGHAIFDTNLFYRTLQRRPELARHLRILNIDVYREERWSYGLVPRPPVTTVQKTWQQVRLWSKRNYWLPPQLRAYDPSVKCIDTPSAELWIDMIRRATNLQVLQMYTPQYAQLQVLDAVRDMATAVVTSSSDVASTLPLSRLQTLSSSLHPIVRRPEISCVDLAPRVSPHDWSFSAMRLPHLQSFAASYTKCDSLTLAGALHTPTAGLNLREFRLDHCVIDPTFIHSLLSLHPNLRKLELLLHHSDDQPEFDGTRILQTIVALGLQLEHLTFESIRPYHRRSVNYLVNACPSFRPLTNLHTLEICLTALLDFGLGADSSGDEDEDDEAFNHHMHDLLPSSIEQLTLLPRHCYLRAQALGPYKRRLRAWLGSDYRPPPLRLFGAGCSLKEGDEDDTMGLGGEMWCERVLERAGGLMAHLKAYEVVRLM
ncbi:hypothetical protein LTR86_008745 [Recurvomyces mirabilis]|nr:hypothetical protein LTR86_008745 [Recurvomyces mirabilis]